MKAISDRGRDGRSVPRPSSCPSKRPQGVRTIFDFFLHRFPRIPHETWVERFATGKVWAKDTLIDAQTPYQPLLEVHYRREVEREPPVRRDYRVVWSDEHLLVVDKPPNLPVTPGGLWVHGCLLHLLQEATGNDQIVPLHRLDRLTSGLVLLSIDPATRSHFSRLFQPRSMVEKVYTAVCELRRDPPDEEFSLAHHIERSPGGVLSPGGETRSAGQLRAASVEVLAVENGLVLLRVRPTTGRKHQLRVQLAHEGLPILGDPLYGTERSHDPFDVSRRLWLDAHRLAVDAFPGPPGHGELTAAWTSSVRRRVLPARASKSDGRG